MSKSMFSHPFLSPLFHLLLILVPRGDLETLEPGLGNHRGGVLSFDQEVQSQSGSLKVSWLKEARRNERKEQARSRGADEDSGLLDVCVFF